jgi:ABC-type transporter Mla subunit MlaD
MSNLEDDLRELADLLPGLPGEAAAADQAATALLAAARPLLEDLDALDEVADEIVAVASALGQAFAKHAQELEQHLRDTASEATASWGTARQAVESAAQGTFAAALALGQAKGTLLTALEAADEAVDPTAQAEAATGSLSEATLEALRDVNNEGVELQQAATAFNGLMTEQVPRVNAATEALQARVGELHDRIAEGAAGLVTALSEKASELDEALSAAIVAFAGALDDQRGLTLEQVRDAVTPLTGASDAARQALAALGAGAESADRRLVEARAGFVQAFAELDEAARPLPPVIQEIHEAYQRVDGL